MPPPRPSISKEAAAAHEATRAAMLDIEAKAHNALRATAGDRGHYSDPVAASRELSARIAPVVQAARQAARRVAAQRMQAEVDALRNDGGPQIELPRLATPGAADLIAAERASRMYGDALLRRAQTLLDDVDRVSAAELSRGTDGALIDIANTEVPHAFNDERRRIERATKERYEGTNWFPLMAKQWDATNDKRLCPRCEALDGKWRPWGVSFAGGLTSPVHARCVPPGTGILTPDGYVPIEALRIGHLVVGGLTGQARRVDQVHKSRVKEALVVVRCGGSVLRLTPNHPVLTGRGWVEAARLKPLDVLYRHTAQVGIADPDFIAGPTNNAPPALDQKSVLGVVHRRLAGRAVPVSRVNLYSDSLAWEREVDVEFAEGHLRNRGHGLGVKRRKEDALGGAEFASHLSTDGLAEHMLHRVRLAPNRSVCCQGEPLSSRRPFLRHSDHSGIVASAPRESCAPKGRYDCTPRNAKPGSQSLDTDAILPMKGMRSRHVKNGTPNRTRNETGQGSKGSSDNDVTTADTFCDFGDRHPLFGVHPQHRNWVQFDSSSHSQSIIHGKAVATQIESISRESYVGLVHNIAVDIDESYVANGIVAHNCRCINVYVLSPLFMGRREADEAA